ncbi:MAG: cardiolipin synthase [Clostridiales bacterium]|nr:cardiolipin synthase [Clostridiales bacterium]
MKKIIFSRIVMVGLLMLLQIIFLVVSILKLSESFVYLYVFFVVLSIVVVIYIVSRKDNPSYKLAWTIQVLLFPLFGGLFYLLFGGNKIRKKLKKQLNENYKKTEKLLVQDEEIIEEINNLDKNICSEVKYIKNFSNFPIYKNTISEYLSPGEKFFERLIAEIKKAKHYIFMEYFIISEGLMWDTVLGVLQEKVKEGVDVRLIYDDVGCITTLPRNYNKKLEAMGIKTLIFNEVMPVLSGVVNNRDHRKITVIDGHTAFTGGCNLADEYINEIVRFGHWQDASLLIKGDAVWSFTIMFLQIWESLREETGDTDLSKFKPKVNYSGDFKNDGYVQPYGDSPYDTELVGENVYLNIINKAKDYVYINTPYLIIDNELVTALTLAAKSGVDVRIITPHIEDKWYVHIITRAYYSQLIEAGVKIYEYTPGFIHSKTFVSDDEIAVVGTINMDYRSLYLHFECGVFMYNTQTVNVMKNDFFKIMEKSQRVTIEDTKDVKWYIVLLRAILKVFAPLM